MYSDMVVEAGKLHLFVVKCPGVCFLWQQQCTPKFSRVYAVYSDMVEEAGELTVLLALVFCLAFHGFWQQQSTPHIGVV